MLPFDIITNPICYNLVVILLFLIHLIAPCPDPGLPNQGNRIGDDFRHDKTVTFTCPRDYIMEGVRKIECSGGRWSYRKPSCKGEFYFLFERVKSFFCHPSWRILHHVTSLYKWSAQHGRVLFQYSLSS